MKEMFRTMGPILSTKLASHDLEVMIRPTNSSSGLQSETATNAMITKVMHSSLLQIRGLGAKRFKLEANANSRNSSLLQPILSCYSFSSSSRCWNGMRRKTVTVNFEFSSTTNAAVHGVGHRNSLTKFPTSGKS